MVLTSLSLDLAHRTVRKRDINRSNCFINLKDSITGDEMNKKYEGKKKCI